MRPRTLRSTASFAMIIFSILILTCFNACQDSTNESDDDQSTDDDNSPELTYGVCLCCFSTDNEIWGYCFSIALADECQTGCEALYSPTVLIGSIYKPDSECLDWDADEICRE
jgi:hypothetical protein